jgi:hypothetical protein
VVKTVAGRKKTGTAADAGRKRFASDLELLEYLKETIVSQIQDGTINLKVGDLLKILEIQKKLATDSSAEEKFWELIEEIRQSGLEVVEDSDSGREE